MLVTRFLVKYMVFYNLFSMKGLLFNTYTEKYHLPHCLYFMYTPNATVDALNFICCIM